MRSNAKRILALLMALACAALCGCAQYVETDAQLPAHRPSPTAVLRDELLAASDVLSIQETHIEYAGGSIEVDAQLLIPDGVTGISIMEVTCGGAEPDFEALRARLVPDAQGETRDLAALEQFNETVKARVAERFSADGHMYLGGLMSYPGRLAYTAALPDELFTENLETAEYGRYSPDGTALNCAISASTALEWTDEIVKLADIDAGVELCAPSVYALSPEPDTRLSCGYYAVYYPLEVGGVPVAVSNPPLDEEGAANQERYVPIITGLGFQCFDMGVMLVEGSWFDMAGARNAGQCAELLSPWQAIDAADAAAAEDYWVKERGAEVVVRELRLEYAVVELDGAFKLIPAWTLDTCEGAALDQLRGIRIDATSGEVLAMELKEI